MMLPELAAKRLELLKELVPRAPEWRCSQTRILRGTECL